MFDKIDVNKAGKFTFDEYKARQSDADAAADRFKRWDADKDGFLTREEYLKQGK